MNTAFFKKWMDKANRSLFFFIALLFHLILFLMVATLGHLPGPHAGEGGFSAGLCPGPPQAAAATAADAPPRPWRVSAT